MYFYPRGIWYIEKAKDKGKKFTIHSPDGSSISFGAEGFSDYTEHKNKKRMESYIARHGSGREDWTDPYTAGFWSRWLLWSEPSFEDAVKLIKRKFGISVVFK